MFIIGIIVKTISKRISSFKESLDMIHFYFVSWMCSWISSSKAYIVKSNPYVSSYIWKDEKPKQAVVQAVVLSLAVLGFFVCVLV
jgi:hypothetical protein